MTIKKTIFLVFFLLACFACTKDDTTKEQDYDITSDYYFAAIIDGEKTLIQNRVDGYANSTSSGGGSTPNGYQQEQGMVFIKGMTANYSAGVVIYKNFPDRTLECSQIEGMFHIGSYPFGLMSFSTNDTGKDGIMVYYCDADGVSWTSSRTPATQSGSSFEITEYIDNTGDLTYPKIMKAKFSCMLYDGKGHSKTLTNGVIRSRCLYCY